MNQRPLAIVDSKISGVSPPLSSIESTGRALATSTNDAIRRLEGSLSSLWNDSFIVDDVEVKKG